MKIIHIIESGGGTTQFLQYLLENMPDFNFSVIYGERTFGKDIQTQQETFKHCEFVFWKYAQRELSLIRDLKATIFLYRYLSKNSWDVVHLHSSKAGFIGRIVCFLLGRRSTIYTPNGLSFVRGDISSLSKYTYIFLEKLCSILGGKIICCSKSEAEKLLEKRINCTYINNGTRIFQNAKNHVRHHSGKITVVTSGRITTQKNPELFNRIAMSFEDNPVYDFVWIGSGELDRLLISSNIKVTGWIDKKHLESILLEADIYISTAGWEGLPFAVLEAMNFSLPLLLSKCVGNIDLVEDGFNGYLFANADRAVEKIKLISHQNEILEAFGKGSRFKVENEFSVESMTKDYREEYLKIAKTSNG